MSDSSEQPAGKPLDDDAAMAAVPIDGRLMGLDYGTVRVGVAVSTPEQSIASPFDNYTRRGEKADARFLKEVADENRIVGVVVGLPRHTGGEEGTKAAEARVFGKWVGEVTGRPVCFWDERFTSAVAEDYLRDAGVPWHRRKERLDMLAAQIMLQSVLDRRRHEAEQEEDPGPEA
ncbi:MAG: Holliday junction resolvase RuvX [Maioricimonas sp. JB049]